MAMDKGNKVTVGVGVSGALASVLMWVVDEIMGIPMSPTAAGSIVFLLGVFGAAISDWWTDDDR